MGRASQLSVVSLQLPTVHWLFADEQSVGSPPVQTPLLQMVPVVQNWPSSQAAPFNGIGSFTHPLAGLQLSAVQKLPSLQLRAGPAVQLPARQLSAVVQAFPSLQAVPSSTGIGSQVSVSSLQVPTVHWLSAAEQSVATPPPHAPALQVSAVVQN